MPSVTRFLQSSTNNQFPASDPPINLTVDSELVIILASLLCAVVCIVGLALVARCAWLRHSAAQSQPTNKGIKKRVLDSLPKLIFSVRDGNNKMEDCAICLAEFEGGDEIRVLPQCEHKFHVVCVDMWLRAHSSCPSCRQTFAIPVTSTCQRCGANSAVQVAGCSNSRYLP